ncbi:MAG TPA: AraC family transcriptional regulator [Prevotella sp.]|nr:AraC family transcriptional regulator [Prevotella sp.]
MDTTLYIKNMVCDRCKMAVDRVLREQGFHPTSIELGVVHIDDVPNKKQLDNVQHELKNIGFELLDDHRQQIINNIKSVIIKLVHYQDNNTLLNMSDFVAKECHHDYSALSKLFSEVTGITLERYYIEQRVERVKELIKYDEQTLTEIAVRMNYSSTAYLSSQFKSVTGMTPSHFKLLKGNTRKSLDEI